MILVNSDFYSPIIPQLLIDAERERCCLVNEQYVEQVQ